MSNTKGTSVISSPSGGGAQSGLGEKFSPDLFTGTGNFSVPIAVPPGRNGFQPELSLGYSSGNGNGCFGLGWALSIPGIVRKTSKGIPIYDDKSDIFILSGAEDLVPVKFESEILPGNIGWERTYYRPRTEGLFARIIRHKKTSGEHYWEVRSKDGLISWYGASTGSATLPTNAVVSNPENRNAIFAWYLTKTQDVFGNVIIYDYTRDLVIDPSKRSYDQLYLNSIKYAQYTVGLVTNYLCEVRFVYENRTDAFSTYKQGFEMRTTKRCSKIETYTNAASLIKTKAYQFNYTTNLGLNGLSLLQSVSVQGFNGAATEFMPPLEFSYSVFNPMDAARRDLREITGPLPVNSLSDPGFELVDITGNGIPDLLQLNGVARYWTNKGNGQFSVPRNLNIAPGITFLASNKAEGAGIPGVAFIDANGDGRTDLMVLNGTTSGYYAGAFNKVWDTNGFKSYKNTPSFNLNDPEVQLMDLDGDGITDVLRNGAKFECFYNHPDKGFHKVKTVNKTFANFSFSDPRIRFADMTGDGLQDIVLISSGRVQYWPNLGYGRFGNKLNMANAPVFPEQYNPAQVLVGDLDGDGMADIAFVENNSVTLYINQSANGFSAPIKIINTPRVVNPKALRIVDILGTGQAGILWSFGADPNANAGNGKLFFLDFTSGNKPYILEQMNNNMGSLTRVKYGSSVYDYIRDQALPATRWQTQLPFPVQVVNRVEVVDLISGGKLVTEYNYHNGYWDGVEREFRGFAHVESMDTESFVNFNAPNLFTEYAATTATVAPQHYSPPVKTKSWFYVGPVGDGYNRWQEPDFATAYWTGDVNVLSRDLATTNLLASLPRRARRDALRTLRGTLLRSELYAMDGSNLQNKPYTITESMMSVRLEFNPSLLPTPLWAETDGGYWAGGGYIFFPFNIGQRTTQYERGTDPMHNFSFTKAYDVYGQAQGQLSIAVPRGASPLSGGAGNYLATYSSTEFIYKDVILGQYMVTRAKRSLAYDASQGADGKSVFTLRDAVFNNPSTLPIISCVLNYYDGLAFGGAAYGQIGNYGAQVRSESLIVTDALLTSAYGAAIPQNFLATPNWTLNYPATFAGLLQNADNRLGYKDRRTGSPDHIPGWYAESDRVKYDFQVLPTLPVEQQLGRVMESRDVFNAWQSMTYDVYQLLPVQATQYLYPFGGTGNSLTTLAVYDYRVMQPFRVTDANLNISEFDFSPLGLLKATAIIGKGTEGDFVSATGTFYQRFAPSAILEYDFFAFKNTSQPVWVKTTSRQQHFIQNPTSNTLVKVEYSDGFGRLLQTRVQAEDVIYGVSTSSTPAPSLGNAGLPISQTAANADAVGTQRLSTDPLNVVVSGWKIYNNKGKVVEQYEPFFDRGFTFTSTSSVGGGALGVKARMFYDSLGRVIRTLNPDNSEQRVVYGVPTNLNDTSVFTPSPWENYAYDANDLAPLTNPIGSNVATTHFYTPKSSVIDALGRTIKTVEYSDNTNYNNTIEMNYTYDVRGNLVQVNDPLGRIVFEHKYDLRTPQKDQPLPPLYTKHIDKGVSTTWWDAAGKPIQSTDAKGAVALSAYDIISRPINSWAKNKTGANFSLRNVMQYGDTAGLVNPQNLNLKTKLYRAYDEAGMVELSNYDFKGNTLKKNRRVISSTTLKTALLAYTTYIVDWTGLPNILETTGYDTDMAYDALNRVTQLTLPQDVTLSRKLIVPTYNNAGALEKVSYDGTVYVENIVYDAKGQRQLIAFGNGVMTRYAYDSLTFRLKRQKSEKYVKTVVANTITYTPQAGSTRQDDGFDYDLVGNIMKILHRVTDCGITSSVLGADALDRNFTYDAINRLLTADGRESNTNTGNSYLYTEAPIPGSPNANTVRSYNRTYSYDKLGNVQSVVQSGVNGFTRSFVYNANVNTVNRINDASNVNIENYTYDANGNQLTAGTTRNYVWNNADQLISYFNKVGTNSPTVFAQYDYSGQDRVSKLVRTGTATTPIYERTIYIDGIFEHVKLESTTTLEKNYVHVMDDKSRIAEIRVGAVFPNDITNTIVYNLETEIGSSCVRLDTLGTVIDREEYYPFGDSSLRTFTYKRYRYVGKDKDAESGLYYYGARYYAAWTCRFISVDPLAGDYMYMTPYNYANNNPIDDFDIDGMQDGKSTTDKDDALLRSYPSIVVTEGDIPTSGTTQTNPRPTNNLSPLDLSTLSGTSEEIGTKIAEHFMSFMQKELADPTSQINLNGFVDVNRIFTGAPGFLMTGGTLPFSSSKGNASFAGDITLNLLFMPGERITFTSPSGFAMPGGGPSSILTDFLSTANPGATNSNGNTIPGFTVSRTARFGTNIGGSVVFSGTDNYPTNPDPYINQRNSPGLRLMNSIGTSLNRSLILRDKTIIWIERARINYSEPTNIRQNQVLQFGSRFNNSNRLINGSNLREGFDFTPSQF
jgi:RHS repeat-associated protein